MVSFIHQCRAVYRAGFSALLFMYLSLHVSNWIQFSRGLFHHIAILHCNAKLYLVTFQFPELQGGSCLLLTKVSMWPLFPMITPVTEVAVLL